MYTAVYGPRWAESKSGFASEKAAEEYIKGRICEGCRDDVDRGWYNIGDPEDEYEPIEVESVLDTNCGAEWFIISDENWEAVAESEDFGMLLDAAGYRRIEKGDANDS
jgi:hypothetical protein